MISLFDDDKSFQRYLRRVTAEAGDKASLDVKFMASLVKKFEKSIDLKKQTMIDLIISPFTIKDLVGKNDSLTTFDIIEKDKSGKRIVPKTAEEIELLKKRLNNNAAFEGGIYVTDKKTGKITDFGIMMRLKESFVYDPIVVEMHGVAAG